MMICEELADGALGGLLIALVSVSCCVVIGPSLFAAGLAAWWPLVSVPVEDGCLEGATAACAVRDKLTFMESITFLTPSVSLANL